MLLRPHAPRSKECAQCKGPFIPARPLQKVCSPRCAARLAKVKRAAEKAEHKEKLEKFKRLPEFAAEAQKEFNAYIRLRDKDQPCICCGRVETSVDGLRSHGWDCGHYRSVGSAAHLRFHEDNAHRQLVYCNRDGAGRAVDYRIGLISRIGLDRVEALEADNTPKKWTREELVAIKLKYRELRKELEKERG